MWHGTTYWYGFYQIHYIILLCGKCSRILTLLLSVTEILFCGKCLRILTLLLTVTEILFCGKSSRILTLLLNVTEILFCGKCSRIAFDCDWNIILWKKFENFKIAFDCDWNIIRWKMFQNCFWLWLKYFCAENVQEFTDVDYVSCGTASPIYMGSIKFTQTAHYDSWQVNLCLICGRTITVASPGNSWNWKNWNHALLLYLHSSREHSLVTEITEKEILTLAGMLELLNNKLFH